MVRIKHRYLLVNILYPGAASTLAKANLPLSTQRNDKLPWSVRFRQPTSDSMNTKILARLIRDGVGELFGDYGSGMVGGSLKVIYFSPATSTAIVRVARSHYRLVWAALSFTTTLPKPIDQPCVFQVVRVSGTIRKSEEEAIRRARLHIVRAERMGRYGAGITMPSVGELKGGKLSRSNAGVEEDDDNNELGMAGGIEDADDGADEDMDDG